MCIFLDFMNESLIMDYTYMQKSTKKWKKDVLKALFMRRFLVPRMRVSQT